MWDWSRVSLGVSRIGKEHLKECAGSVGTPPRAVGMGFILRLEMD